MKKILPLAILIGSLISISLLTSCDKVNELVNPETETEKTTRIFVDGSPWKLDTLNYKEDVLSGGNSTVTYDTTYFNYGTIEFLDPAAAENPGYNAGYAIHRYTDNGQQKVDSIAWAPYNHYSGGDNHVTFFYHDQNSVDFVVGAWDMYLDKIIIEEDQVIVRGWRRETIPGGSGGSYGIFRSYSLSRR